MAHESVEVGQGFQRLVEIPSGTNGAREHWKMLDTMGFMDTVIVLPLEV